MFRTFVILFLLFLVHLQLKAGVKHEADLEKYRQQSMSANPEEAMLGYRMLSNKFFRSNMDSAHWYAKKYRAFSEEHNSINNIVHSYRVEAHYFLQEGNQEAALGSLQEAWKVAREEGDGNIKAELLGTIAGIYYNAGFFQAARRYLKDQLKITEDEPFIGNGRFGVLTNLGFCTMELADQIPEMMDSVEAYFFEAQEVARKSEAKAEEYLVYDYLGEFELKRGDAHAAQVYFQKEYDLWEGYSPTTPSGETHLVFQGRAAFGLAKTYKVMGQPSMVLKYSTEARRIWGQVQVDVQDEKLAKLKLIEASSHLMEGNRVLARIALEEGVELAGKLRKKSNSGLSEIYEEAGSLMAKLGAFKESNALLQKFIDLENEKKLEADQWAFFSNHSDLMNQVLELDLEQEMQATEQARKVRNLALGTTTVVLILGLLILFLYRNLRKSHHLNQSYAEELVELNETREKLISILGHDLRGPFQSIMLMSEKAQTDLEDMESGQVKGAFKVIGESSREMYFLFENLLEWARSQSGTLSYQPEEIDLRGVLQETKVALQSLTEANGVSVRIELDSSLVVGDPFMVRTIFRNLLGNAIRHSPKGSEIEIASRSSETGKTIISVIDQGEGMGEEALDMLREGVHHSSGKQGLGLVLCRDFLGLHGSELEIQSEIGKGSRFSFELDSGSTEGEAYREVIQKGTIESEPLTDLDIPALCIQKRLELSEEFKGIRVYQTSRAHALMSALEEAGMPESSVWKDRFQHSLSEYDEGEFGQLIAFLFAESNAIHDPIRK